MQIAMQVARFESPVDLDWRTVNDTVMGGRSTSQFQAGNGMLLFSGYLNTNGGGFASIRSAAQQWNLDGSNIVRVRVLGDGRPYQIRLHPKESRVSYKFPFSTVDGKWQVVEAPIAQFQATWRGRELDRPPLSVADISSVGFLLADGKDGDFNLTVDWIEFAAAPRGQASN